MRESKQKLILTVHHRSDTGRMRDHNEDYLGYRQPKDPTAHIEADWLYAVADGIGGAQAGEVASKLAVQTLLNAYYQSTQETPAGRLREAFAEANCAVYDQAKGQQEPNRMGTTLVAAAIRGQELTVANVGDSRAYLIHNDQINQISRDHSVVARLVAEGIITPEQAEIHPRRHVISRSIGGQPQIETDIFTETFLPGDCLLLCSDGLTEHVSDAEILAVMQSQDPEAGVQRLVDLANQSGGSDNITVLTVHALRGRKSQMLATKPLPETKKRGVSRRPAWPWIGVVVAALLLSVAGLIGGIFLILNPTPTPTPTATATAASTPMPTTTPTSPPLPTSTLLKSSPEPPTATPLPTATDTQQPTRTPSPTAAATATPSPTKPETASPTATETPMPSPTLTPTGTTESSPLSTPIATATPTPTSTTEASPLARPTP